MFFSQDHLFVLELKFLVVNCYHFLFPFVPLIRKDLELLVCLLLLFLSPVKLI